MGSQVSSHGAGSIRSRGFVAAGAVVALLAAMPARAQLPVPASSQFDITGFIQEAKLGGPGTGAGVGAHQGGTIKVNGHTIIIPSETIVILPASAYSWAELFALSPAPYTGVYTGLALSDVPTPMTTYEAHVVGNRVLGGSGGPDVYIAGLVHIAQHDLAGGAGFINYMDYDLGEMRVGGLIPDVNCVANPANTVAGGPTCSGTRVRILDPVGRFGRTTTAPDPRFAVDDANPTIISSTGFPMCFPRVPPTSATPDALCPEGNRTGLGTVIQMNDPVALPGLFPDATRQAPLEVGDYVTFAGTLVQDGAAPTAGPWPAAGAAATYVAAHTITDNVAIYTWPGSNPAYVMIEVSLIGTGGLTVIGAGEAAIRTRFEGMTTDPTRNIHLYGVDLDPATGNTTDRDWGTIGVDPGAPTGAVKGRWRFRPPCTATVADQKSCTPPPAGTFLPPAREVRAVIEGQQSQVPGLVTAKTSANGIFYGQYHAPIGEYIFPENIPGAPIVENNFNSIDFLTKGGYVSSGGTLAKVLDPWPSNVVPTPACVAPTAIPGGPYTVASGGTVNLTGSASGTAPFTYAWTASSGSIANANLAVATYSALGATPPVTVSLTVTNACGTSTASTSVTVNAAGTPTVAPIGPVAVFSGAINAAFTVSATDPNAPPQKLTFAVTQTGTPALLNLKVGSASCGVVSANTCTAQVTFTAPTLPIGQVTPSTVTVSVTATNTGGATSAPATTTVTVKPVPDNVAITATEYRTGKQRLIVNASSSVTSPNVVLTLQPYACQTVAGQVACPPSGTFDPTALGNTLTNNGGGLYVITLVGAPPPACNPPSGAFATPCQATPLTVKSNLNGTSPPHGLDKIRQ